MNNWHKSSKYAFSFFIERLANDMRLLPTHFGLALALLYHHNCERPCGYFRSSRRKLMHFSGIRSTATYHKCIADLINYGYLEYMPSWHPTEASQFRFVMRTKRKRQQ